VDPTGVVNWDAFPVTFDNTQAATFTQANYSTDRQTLRDLVWGNEWSLRRIVGKCFVTLLRDTGDTPENTVGIAAVEVAAGFIVGRTDDEGTATVDFTTVNPLNQDSQDDPWIWRRKWIIQSGPIRGAWSGAIATQDQINLNGAATGFPLGNALCGSVADGPHIDQKTARAIKRQERLYFVIANRLWDPYTVTEYLDEDTYVTYNLDYRLLGRLGGSVGNRNNASR